MSLSLAIVAGVGLAGCQAASVLAKAVYETGDHKVYAEYDGLRGHDFAVIINMDQMTRANDPRLANRLTNALTRLMTDPEMGASGVVPGPFVLEFQYSNPAWQTWDYEQIADEFTVSRLVIVDLYEYQLNEPGNRHVWGGRAGAHVGVYEANLGTSDFAYTRDIQVRFPDGTGFTKDDVKGDVVAANLEDRLVRRIAWLMYDHEEPNTIKY